MLSDEASMRLAIEEAERARGRTGDNPWVGCVIVDASGALVASGFTQGPGEDHAEIVAIRVAQSLSIPLSSCTLYSTLEPCAFHGRTPACAQVIASHHFARVVTGIRDPNPRVDGEGIAILQRAGTNVTEGALAAEIRKQLGPWIVSYHPHEPQRFIQSISRSQHSELICALQERYAIETSKAAQIIAAMTKSR